MSLPILGIHNVQSPVDAFILDISHYMGILHPKDAFIFIEDFNPSTYFITSGDAIEKAKNLCADLKRYKADVLNLVRAIGTYTDQELEMCGNIDIAIENSERMLEDLYRAKGENCFLETEWDQHNIVVVPKNPRK